MKTKTPKALLSGILCEDGSSSGKRKGIIPDTRLTENTSSSGRGGINSNTERKDSCVGCGDDVLDAGHDGNTPDRTPYGNMPEPDENTPGGNGMHGWKWQTA